MKIGVMLRNIGEKGGIVVYAKNLLKNLLTIDSKNHYVLMYRYPEDLGHFEHFPNVTEEVLYAPNKLIWDQVAVPLFAKRRGLDVIYNPKLSIPLVTQCKTVWVMHGAAQFVLPHVFRLHDRIYFTVANRLFAKKATAIITMTHLGAKDIATYMGADPNKIRAIYEAYNQQCRVLEKDETVEVNEKYGLPDQFILYVGGITPLKNFGNLLRAYQRLQPLIPHKLVAAGFNRWKFANDLKLVEELGLRDHVLFTGYVEDEELPVFYNLASAFVFPSLYEGFGIPVLEAMACGCPVIASKTGCSREVAGGAAMLVDPYKVDEIAESIQRVLGDETLREELIAKGLERARQFSWQRCAVDTLAVFESLNEST